MSEIPIPQDTGSTGTQEPLLGGPARAEEESPLKGLPITQTVQGLAATHSRSMGGEVAANLIAGSFNQLSHDLQSTKQELSETRDQLRQANSDLSRANVKIATLEANTGADSRERHLKNFCIFAGTTFLGIGIELYKNNFDKFAYITGLLGTLLLLFGWIPSGGRPKE